jgi:hypothetical protein
MTSAGPCKPHPLLVDHCFGSPIARARNLTPCSRLSAHPQRFKSQVKLNATFNGISKQSAASCEYHNEDAIFNVWQITERVEGYNRQKRVQSRRVHYKSFEEDATRDDCSAELLSQIDRLLLTVLQKK